MVPGGIFSVTLSVTRDSHPQYPHFHEACRLPVFGLSSSEKKILASDRLPRREKYHRPASRSSPAPAALDDLSLLWIPTAQLTTANRLHFASSDQSSMAQSFRPGDRPPPGHRQRIGNFQMKLRKSVLLFRSDFREVFAGGALRKKLLRGVGKLI
jgi:hypothetical protein